MSRCRKEGKSAPKTKGQPSPFKSSTSRGRSFSRCVSCRISCWPISCCTPCLHCTAPSGRRTLSADATVLYAAHIQETAHRAPEGPFRRFGFRNLSLHGDEMRERAWSHTATFQHGKYRQTVNQPLLSHNDRQPNLQLL